MKILDGYHGFLGWVDCNLWPSLFAGCNTLWFLPTGIHGCRNILGELAVGEITQTKTKKDIPTWNILWYF